MAVLLRYGVLADAVVKSSGKWSAVGAFQVVATRSVPTNHGPFGLMMRIEAAHGDIGTTKTISVDFVNPLGETIAHRKIAATFAAPQLNAGPPALDIGMTVPPLPLPVEGNYDFVIRADGEYVDAIPMYVRVADLPGPLQAP